jgi:FkbM family methyltransferase
MPKMTSSSRSSIPVASEPKALRLDIREAGLGRYEELAKAQAIDIFLHDTFIELIRDKQVVKMNRGHAVYLRGMLLRFDYYFSAVRPYFEQGLSVVDYSSPRFQQLSGFEDFPVYFHSYPEPMASSDAYLSFANLKSGDVVLDLGAYAGMASILFSKQVGDHGMVVSYEPDPHNHEAATINTGMHKKFSGLDNIRLNRQAIWRDEGGLEFSCDGNMGSSASQIVGKRGEVRQVETTTLDGILRKHGLTHIDFLKIDIEGAEIEVIKQSLPLLKRLKPPIVMESHRVDNQHSAAVCGELLHSIGYETWTSSGDDVFSDYLLFAR